jgi:hypothetical protein
MTSMQGKKENGRIPKETEVRPEKRKAYLDLINRFRAEKFTGLSLK